MRMRKLNFWPGTVLLGALLMLFSSSLFGMTINGAGASFPAPAYKRWALKFHKETGIRINYQSVGSGSGIKKIKAKTVDFGASDKPLKKPELDAAGLIQFPMLIGGVVVIVNIEGVKEGTLKLTPKLLSNIFLGKIKKWNNKAIAELNPAIKLPNRDITVVHRSDGSGTTWIFTNYLTKVSQDWSNGPGSGKSIAWPVGLGGAKNAGVAATVKRVKGSIGYVEFAYAKENKLAFTLLQNKNGYFSRPSIKSFQSAAASADWDNAPGFYMVLTNQPGKNTWPITGATYILMHKQQKKYKVAKTALSFFDWSYMSGASTAIQLRYVPMPKNVISKVRKLWKRDLTYNGKRIY